MANRFSSATLVLLVGWVAVLCGVVPEVGAYYYVPGAKPTFYKDGEAVPFTVNAIRSTSEMFPRDYYSNTGFCRPASLKRVPESIGEILWGDRMYNSLYTVNMKENNKCRLLPNCDPQANMEMLQAKVKALEKFIELGYRGFMNIDNLPVFTNDSVPLMGTCVPSFAKDPSNQNQRGYALGVPKACRPSEKKTYINTHLEFRIQYNVDPDWEANSSGEAQYMVVGLTVKPYSIKFTDPNDCNEVFNPMEYMDSHYTTDDIRNNNTLYWTYSVQWELRSDIVWATRWDAYFHSSLAGSRPQLHYTYIATSVVIVLCTAAAVMMILLRSLHKDFNRYNTDDPEDLQEETGWKLIHADVFRPPDRTGLLSAMMGNGYQILFMVTGVLFFALLGYLSPSNRGALLRAILLLSVMMGIVGGYVCGFLLRYFNRKEWKYVFVCGAAFPGVICSAYLLTEIIGKAKSSTAAAPFSVILLVLALWLLVAIPLTVIGASVAFRQEPLSNPVRVGRLAREIPEQSFMNRPVFLFTVPALFPFCTVIMELHFMMQALWAGQVYYVFGFLSFVAVLWMMVCSLVTIVQLYYVLCYENHRWWWIAFVLPGGLGGHVFLYSIYFYNAQLVIRTFSSALLYFIYMGLISFAYGLAAGAIGLTSGIVFVRAIYARIKVD